MRKFKTALGNFSSIVIWSVFIILCISGNFILAALLLAAHYLLPHLKIRNAEKINYFMQKPSIKIIFFIFILMALIANH